MNHEEYKLIEDLGEAYNRFTLMCFGNRTDCVEFMQHIHILQRHIMALSVRREHPQLFHKSTLQDEQGYNQY